MRKHFFLIVLLTLIVLTVGVFVLLPRVNALRSELSPVTGIEVTNKKTYAQGQTIKKSDFDVKYIHKNGTKTDAPKENISLSRKRPAKTGATTKVTVTCVNGEEEYTETLQVKNRREVVLKFNCGSPDLKSVQAVLYSNGELCFEGEGDVRQFNEFPWKSYEADTEIISVTFTESVTPTIMDHWFSDMETLTYVPLIPASVTSAAQTFANDTALQTGPDLTACTGLLNTTSMFEGCSSLEELSALPASVRVADAMCKDMVSLKAAPDLSGSTGLAQANEMFSGCTNLITASVPPGLVSGESMYAECINLKEMPGMPETVTNMAGMFQGDYSLTTVTNVPAACTDYSNCFSNCTSLQGTLTINAETSAWGGFLDGAAVATDLDLTGSSSQLALIGEEYYGEMNLTINGQAVQAPAGI